MTEVTVSVLCNHHPSIAGEVELIVELAHTVQNLNLSNWHKHVVVNNAVMKFSRTIETSIGYGRRH